jgi:hypothetical protein
VGNHSEILTSAFSERQAFETIQVNFDLPTAKHRPRGLVASDDSEEAKSNLNDVEISNESFHLVSNRLDFFASNGLLGTIPVASMLTFLLREKQPFGSRQHPVCPDANRLANALFSFLVRSSKLPSLALLWVT